MKFKQAQSGQVDSDQAKINQESDVLDYINGHLSPEQHDAFEKKLAQDEDLLALVKESKSWQADILATSTVQSDEKLPEFNRFEAKIKHTRSRFPMGASIAAALVIAVVFGFNQTPLVNNEFETLTDTSINAQVNSIQIVLANDVDTQRFVKDYQLKVIDSFDNASIIEVQVDSNIENLITTLSTDKRTMLVKRMGSKQ